MLKGYQINGSKEFLQMVKLFGEKEAKKIARKVMKRELKPVLAKVKSDYPKDTGDTAKSFKINTRTRRGIIYVNVAALDMNFIVKFLEFGVLDYAGNVTSKPKARKEFLMDDSLGIMNKDGKWRIKPMNILGKIFDSYEESIAAGTVKGFLDEADKKLGKLMK